MFIILDRVAYHIITLYIPFIPALSSLRNFLARFAVIFYRKGNTKPACRSQAFRKAHKEMK